MNIVIVGIGCVELESNMCFVEKESKASYVDVNQAKIVSFQNKKNVYGRGFISLGGERKLGIFSTILIANSNKGRKDVVFDLLSEQKQEGSGFAVHAILAKNMDVAF